MKDIDREGIPEDIKDLYKKDMEKCLDDHGKVLGQAEMWTLMAYGLF